MKTLRFAAVVLALMAPFSGPAGARESCGEIWRDHVLTERDMAALRARDQRTLSELDGLNRELATVQSKRRELRCIDDAHDRAVFQRCRMLDKHYVVRSERRAYLSSRLEEDRTALASKRARRDRALERFERQCTCWTAGRAHTGMDGRNILGFQARDLDHCKVRCNQTGGCRSIDYNATDRSCYLNDLDSRSRAPAPTFTTRPAWPFTYYERCS